MKSEEEIRERLEEYRDMSREFYGVPRYFVELLEWVLE